MEFLELNEVAEWARERGLVIGEYFRVILPELPHRARLVYAHGQRSGLEGAAAQSCIRACIGWKQCLLVATEWGIWPSSEDWPRFYAWRGARDERRSLEKAPGHLFGAEESDELCALLTQVLEYAWDASLLFDIAGSATTTIAKISHDEWLEVRSRQPVSLAPVAA